MCTGKLLGTKNIVENEKNQVPTLMVLPFNKLVLSMCKVPASALGHTKNTSCSQRAQFSGIDNKNTDKGNRR